MRTTVSIALLAAALLLTACNGDRGLRHSRTGGSTARHALPPKLERVEPLDAERVKSGEITLADTNSLKLEATLQDLNRRKDFDYAQHGGQSGPDAAYLNEWVEKVKQELLRRGYYVDSAGNLHRPGAVVAWR